VLNVAEHARKFLESLHRFDLAMLLSQCRVSIERVTERDEVDFDWGFGTTRDVVAVHAPSPIDEALKSLLPEDRKRIAQAATSSMSATRAPDDIQVETIVGATADGAPALLAELLIHRAIMISVATGGFRIQEVDDFYRARQARIVQDLPTDVQFDNPHGDLWDFYHFWDANLPQWKDRRRYVREMFGPAIAAIAKRSSISPIRREPTGWERVDRALSKARDRLASASAEEDFQAIGLICREVIISLAQAVYDPSIHESLDGVVPSETDANRMLGAFIGHAFPGESNKEVRAHARASLALALNLQHRRTASQQLAMLCVEATASTTAVISIIARPVP
jgi:hypothetical protein